MDPSRREGVECPKIDLRIQDEGTRGARFKLQSRWITGAAAIALAFGFHISLGAPFRYRMLANPLSFRSVVARSQDPGPSQAPQQPAADTPAG